MEMQYKENYVSAVIAIRGVGDVNVKLYPDAAPQSVAAFVSCAKDGYYNGLCFHRVIPDFMIQGGGLRISGQSLVPAPDRPCIKGEFASNGYKNPIKHKRGVLSMARTMVPDSASSQFFICVADCAWLDGEYAAFGEVADDASMARVMAISGVRTCTLPQGYRDVPVQPIIIDSVTVVNA